MSDLSTSPAHIFYQARLSPYRSLSPAGFRRIMTTAIGASLIISSGLYMSGAWPVFGFLGLDILALYLALRASFRSARIAEILELNERELIIEKENVKGEKRRWSFQPNWLRVELDEPVMPTTPLLLRSHGRSFAIGAFLCPDERRRVADSLSRALNAWRNRR